MRNDAPRVKHGSSRELVGVTQLVMVVGFPHLPRCGAMTAGLPAAI